MSVTEQHEKTDKSLDLREKSRYAASLRLSVAPMMDWTDTHCRVFHRLLARAQGGNLGLQIGNFLDLVFQPLDFSLEEIVLALLRRYLRLIPKVDAAGNDATQHGSRAQRRVERLAHALARSFAVG